MIREIFIIKKLFNHKKSKVIVFQYGSFLLLVWYFILSRFFRANFYINTMEYHIAIKNSLNARLFDKYSYFFSDGVIVISKFLEKLVKQRFPKHKTLVLPVTVDFNMFGKYDGKIHDYSLFCASAGHIRVFKYVINAFNYVDNKNHQLVLVGNGKAAEMDLLRNAISKSPYTNRIKLYSNLDYNSLILKYQQAKLLLIPMYNDERDMARFPHKIGEYTASKRPILLTPIGDSTLYFQDNVSAFFSRDTSESSFGHKMNNVLKDDKLLNKVGEAGFNIGIESFDYLKQGEILSKYFKDKNI